MERLGNSLEVMNSGLGQDFPHILK
jgi:hypothetical protein